jgi:hypothetical protein
MHKKARDEFDRQAGDMMDSIVRIIVWWAVIGLCVFGVCWVWNALRERAHG